jgi:hypothetical protein
MIFTVDLFYYIKRLFIPYTVEVLAFLRISQKISSISNGFIPYAHEGGAFGSRELNTPITSHS